MLNFFGNIIHMGASSSLMPSHPQGTQMQPLVLAWTQKIFCKISDVLTSLNSIASFSSHLTSSCSNIQIYSLCFGTIYFTCR